MRERESEREKESSVNIFCMDSVYPYVEHSTQCTVLQLREHPPPPPPPPLGLKSICQAAVVDEIISVY